MSAQLSPVPKMQFCGTTGAYQGKPLAGGWLYTCIPGGTIADLKPTYTDYSATAENTNPIILDINGMANIWLTGYYKFFLYDVNGVLQYNIDNVSAGGNGSTATGLWQEQAFTPIFVSSDMFSAPSNLVSLFPPGQRIMASMTNGNIYGTVDTSSYDPSADKTTIVSIWDSGQLDDTIYSISISAIVQSPSPLPICPVVKHTASYTLGLAYMGHMLLFGITTDSIVTLPDPATVPSGSWFRIKNIGPAQLTIGGTVNGLVSLKMGIMDEAFIYTDNINWLGVFSSIGYPIEVVSTSLTIPSWAANRIYMVSVSTITLPTASSVNSGTRLKIFSNNASLTVYGTINNTANMTLNLYDCVDLFSDGSSWWGSGNSTQGTLAWNYIDGLGLRNPSGTVNLIDTAGGSCVDHSQNVMLYSPRVISKVTSRAWSYGDNGGGLDIVPSSTANLMWYVYIMDTATKNAVDVIMSQNPVQPSLPTSYVYYRLVGAFKTHAVSLPIDGAYYGDYFYFKNTNVVDYSYTFPKGSTTTITPTLSVPANATGIIQIRYGPSDTGAGLSESTSIILSVGPQR